MTLDQMIGKMAEKTLGANTQSAKAVLDAYLGSGVPAATAEKAGVVKQAANVAALSGSAELSDVVTAVNAILSAMKTAGSMVKDS